MRPARNALLSITLLATLAGVGATAGLRADRLETERAALDARYAHALDLFRGQRYAAAYGRLMTLADAGHLPAAQAALLMLRNGKAMFGSEWSATESQQMHWNALIVAGSRARMTFASGSADE